jgi:hypothetical protein
MVAVGQELVRGVAASQRLSISEAGSSGNSSAPSPASSAPASGRRPPRTCGSPGTCRARIGHRSPRTSRALPRRRAARRRRACPWAATSPSGADGGRRRPQVRPTPGARARRRPPRPFTYGHLSAAVGILGGLPRGASAPVASTSRSWVDATNRTERLPADSGMRGRRRGRARGLAGSPRPAPRQGLGEVDQRRARPRSPADRGCPPPLRSGRAGRDAGECHSPAGVRRPGASGRRPPDSRPRHARREHLVRQPSACP